MDYIAYQASLSFTVSWGNLLRFTKWKPHVMCLLLLLLLSRFSHVRLCATP